MSDPTEKAMRSHVGRWRSESDQARAELHDALKATKEGMGLMDLVNAIDRTNDLPHKLSAKHRRLIAQAASYAIHEWLTVCLEESLAAADAAGGAS